MRQARLRRLVGIVSMMKDGYISDAVRDCFHSLGAICTIYRYDTPNLVDLIAHGPETHWFFTGNGPDFVTDEGAPAFDMRILDIHNKSMFFVCYSHQYICKQLGARIRQCWKPIRGVYPIVRVRGDCDPIFKGLDWKQRLFAYYGQYVRTEDVPAGWDVLARQGNHVVLMRRCGTENIYSCQLHPERLEETYGMLRNWLMK